ncbi:MAG: hypothetical protein GY858_01745 [Candidatus Omnitrophica bacterium]|nr:hypothetical protein [Candidatus Omnitrophota bacterium]
MHPKLKKKYQDFLNKIADQLSHKINIPVDVNKLCAQFNVIVVRSNIVQRNKEAILLTENIPAEIHLPLRKEKELTYTPYERLKIIHELGHLLLRRKYTTLPLGPSEYWQHEDLCNFFARKVLLPEEFIKVKMINAKDTPDQRLALTNFLSEKAFITWPTAAYRVSDLDRQFAFFEIKINKHTDNSEGPSFHFSIIVSTLPNKKMIFTKFYADNKIGQILIHAPEKKIILLDDTVFESPDVVKKFPSFFKVKEGAIYSEPPNKFRMAVRL